MILNEFYLFAKYNKYLVSGPSPEIEKEANLGASTQIESIDLDHQIKNDDFFYEFHIFLQYRISICLWASPRVLKIRIVWKPSHK